MSLAFLTLALNLSIPFLLPESAAQDVFLVQKFQGQQLVYFRIQTPFGFIHDWKGKEGLHLALAKSIGRGTTSKSKDQLDSRLDELGIEFSSSVYPEYSTFDFVLPPTNLETGFALIEDIIFRPSFESSQFNRTKVQMISEALAAEDDDSYFSKRIFLKQLYGFSSESNSPLGTERGINSLTKGNLTDRHSIVFNAKQLKVICSGCSETQLQNFKARLKSISEIQTQSNTPTTSPSAAGKPKENTLYLMSKKGLTNSHLYLGIKAWKYTDPRTNAFKIGNETFGGDSLLSTLMIELREKTGWTYGASSNVEYGREYSHFFVHLFPSVKSTSQALEKMIELFSDFRNGKLSPAELERTRKNLSHSGHYLKNNPIDSLNLISSELGLELQPGTIEKRSLEIEKISDREVIQSVKELLNDQHWTALAFSSPEGILKIKEQFSKNRNISLIELQDSSKK